MRRRRREHKEAALALEVYCLKMFDGNGGCQANNHSSITVVSRSIIPAQAQRLVS